MNEVKLEIER